MENKPTENKFREITDKAIIILFLIAIYLPLIGPRLGLGERRHLTEKRRLTSLPSFEWSARYLKDFPAAFETYFMDHFGFREGLIRWHNFLQASWFGLADSSRLIIGKDRWLFYSGEGLLDYYRATKPFTPQELEAWKALLEDYQAWLGRQHIAYFVVVAPEKSSIYPEYMPDAFNRVGKQTRLDQLIAYLQNQKSAVRVLDLRPALLAAKQKARIYHKTDTHWNALGALTAAQAILRAVQNNYPSIQIPDSNHYNLKEEPSNGLDLAKMLALETYYQEDVLELIPRSPARAHSAALTRIETDAWKAAENAPLAMETGNSPLPNAVMFRDSFSDALIPFLSEDFRRIVYVWTHTMMPVYVRQEHPAIVISEIAERYLMQPPPETIEHQQASASIQ